MICAFGTYGLYVWEYPAANRAQLRKIFHMLLIVYSPEIRWRRQIKGKKKTFNYKIIPAAVAGMVALVNEVLEKFNLQF